MVGPDKVYALLPVKRLHDSKSRLSNILDTEERETLTLLMLEDVVKTIQASELALRILIVTPDEKVIRFAKGLCIDSLVSDSGDLNRDLEEALAWCSKTGAESALIVLADLPILSEEDIKRIISPSSQSPNAVIAPSKDGGTNVLFLHPCDLITPSFGVGSFERHILKLRSIGADVRVYRSVSTALDIDTPEDMREFLDKNNNLLHAPKSLTYLEKIRIIKAF
ncbi:MAG: 2-phospho-L-lactate guanylyltransferase [Candidatus Bathyarchaeia archaeon]